MNVSMLSTLRFHISILLIASLIAVAGGCAKRAASPPEARLPITTGEVEMARQSFATLYPPEPLPAPATQPAEPAPLESLELFARARRAMLDGHRSIAMDLLEQAARIDPYSFEIKYLLAQAILGNNVSNERSIEILEEAVRLRPEHLAARVLLGRQYLARSQPDHALRHLVIASRTREYDRDDDAAAVTDFFLARALQARGFHAAALERFERLERRLRTGSLAIRTNPELNYLAARPELLYVQMAELHEAVGSPAEALRLYRPAGRTATRTWPAGAGQAARV
jgi:tetratricopeptide (TPR) repeat protein